MIVSGLLSTVDSNLCAASSLMTDMNGGKELKKTKCAMIALLCVGILIANIPGMTSYTPVSVLWNAEGVNAVADHHDIEGSKAYAQRNPVWCPFCVGRRAPYFCLRNGFK